MPPEQKQSLSNKAAQNQQPLTSQLNVYCNGGYQATDSNPPSA